MRGCKSAPHDTSAGRSGVAANDFFESESDFELNNMEWRNGMLAQGTFMMRPG